MALKTKSVPLGELVNIFDRHGVDRVRLNTVMGYLVNVGRLDSREMRSIQAPAAIDLLNIDDLPRAMLKLEATIPLLELADVIHSEFTGNNIVSWVVKDRVILLEMT